MAANVNNRWSDPFLVDPDELMAEQIERVRTRNSALREYYRTGDPTEAIRVGAVSKEVSSIHWYGDYDGSVSKRP